jgi:hypothetical protein
MICKFSLAKNTDQRQDYLRILTKAFYTQDQEFQPLP